MKKVLILVVFALIIVLSLSAGVPRTYLQKCLLNNGAMPDVQNTGTTHNANYILRATNMTTNETLGTDLGTPTTTIRIFKAGVAPNQYTGAYLQLGTFPTQWVVGDVIHFVVTYVPTMEVGTWDFTIPTGGAGINILDPAVVIPPTIAGGFQISGAITSLWDLSGVTITATGIDAADITYNAGAYTIDVPSGWSGTVTPAKATYVFTPADRVYTNVTANVTGQDYVMKTIVAPGAPTNLAPNGTAFEWAAAQSVNLTWDAVANAEGYKVMWNNGAATDIGNVLTWATPALDTGAYVWKVLAYNNTATKSMAPVKVRVNDRSNNSSPKADGAWSVEASFTVTVTVPPTYWDCAISATDNLSNPIADVVIWKDDVNTGFTAPHTFNMLEGSTAVYKVKKDGWTFTPAQETVGPIYTVVVKNFVGTENVIIVDPENPPANITIVDNTYYITYPDGEYWDITFQRPAGFTDPWYIVTPLEEIEVNGPTYTIYNFYFAHGKGTEVFELNDEPTLPVELSYFAATLTAQNFVKLTWVSQSETGLLGYRVYRSENSDQASAVSITPSMIPATNTSTTQTYNVVDEEVAIGNTYYYWLESVDMGHSTFFGPTSVLVQGEVPPVLPEYTTMRNAYPNPFRANTGTTIEVNVKAGETGQVTIYNVLGQVVKTYSVKEGINPINWNGRDSKGNVCGSGIYFYKLSTPSMNMTKKMVIVK